jgi:hypothetical protein
MSSVASLLEPMVSESRRTPRFILDPAIPATFEDIPVLIYNIGESGIQFEHKQKIQRFQWGEVRFALPISPRVIRLQGRVTWCRMARGSDPLQPWPYRCGLAVEGLHALTIDTLAGLLRSKSARPDRNSLERKKKLLLERQSEEVILPGSVVETIPPPLTMEECINRVQSARSELRRDPANAALMLSSGQLAWRDAPASDEVVAVWQQLRQSVDPALISVVFDLYPE